jgi:hypothetical protein
MKTKRKIYFDFIYPDNILSIRMKRKMSDQDESRKKKNMYIALILSFDMVD